MGNLERSGTKREKKHRKVERMTEKNMMDQEFIEMMVSERVAVLLRKKADPEETEILDRAEGILRQLEKGKREQIERYVNYLISSEAENQEQIYREGIRDGILLMKKINRIEPRGRKTAKGGEEAQKMDLKLPGGKHIRAPKTVRVSEVWQLDGAEYSLWSVIEEYMELFGMEEEDSQPDFEMVRAVQERILEIFKQAGITFEL